MGVGLRLDGGCRSNRWKSNRGEGYAFDFAEESRPSTDGFRRSADINAAVIAFLGVESAWGVISQSQGIGSAKYADFFFRHRRSYPFTRKTFPVLGGRVEPSNEEWDGIDPDTGEAADWLKVDDFTTPSRSGQRRCDDDPGANPGRVYGRGKRARSPYLALEGPSSKTLALTWTDADATVKSESSGGSPMELEAPASRGGGESHRTLHRDLKMLMDALRQIPTPRRAALAIEGMLSKPEVQYALEKFGTGSELGLTRKELAAIAVLQDAVSYQGQ
ncbi:hypothetical protein BSKO_09775 [Bryopsis sp. KO-2023]|nr:hypothetical protein BSKO_09775 [Bryopsis sp. KO-2023]